MDVSVIISKSRVQTSTSAGQKSDALMLADLNIVYQGTFSALNAVSKKYTWQTYRVDSVVAQNEYNIPKATSTDTWLQRVLNMYIKYASDKDYIPCKEYDTSHPIDNDYKDYTKPYFINRDDSIFVYPAPTEIVADALIIEGNYLPLLLELDTLSASIKLAPDNHDILLYGLNMWNFWDKMLINKQIEQKNLYDAWLKTLISQWWMDMESGYIQEEPDLSCYE